MSNVVLFICHANVCRSRLMEHEFQAAEEASGAARWSASSAGVAAAAGQPLCEEVASIAAEAPNGAPISVRGAVQLDRRLLRDAGLLITATRAERAEVALLMPSLRSRTFTLKEAVALAGLVPSSAEPDLRNDASAALAQFAETLDRRRGSVRAARQVEPGRLHLRGRSDEVDVPDAHHRRAREHRRMLRAVQAASVALHGHLDAFAGRRGPAVVTEVRSGF